MGFEGLNADVRWTSACRQLDGGNTLIFAKGENANESHYPPLSRRVFAWADMGFEEAGPTAGGVKKCPVDAFLGRGRIHGQVTASGTDVGTCPSLLSQSICPVRDGNPSPTGSVSYSAVIRRGAFHMPPLPLGNGSGRIWNPPLQRKKTHPPAQPVVVI